MKYQKGTPEWKAEWMPVCKADLLACEGNPFIENLKTIQGICYREGVDVGVGLDMYINETYTHEERKELDAEHFAQYKKLCGKYYLDFLVEVQEAMITEKDTVPFAEE